LIKGKSLDLTQEVKLLQAAPWVRTRRSPHRRSEPKSNLPEEGG